MRSWAAFTIGAALARGLPISAMFRQCICGFCCVGGREGDGRGGGGRYVDIYRHMQAYMSAVAHLSNPSNLNRNFCMNKFNNHTHSIKDILIRVHKLYTYIHIPTTQSLHCRATYRLWHLWWQLVRCFFQVPPLSSLPQVTHHLPHTPHLLHFQA